MFKYLKNNKGLAHEKQYLLTYFLGTYYYLINLILLEGFGSAS